MGLVVACIFLFCCVAFAEAGGEAPWKEGIPDVGGGIIQVKLRTLAFLVGAIALVCARYL